MATYQSLADLADLTQDKLIPGVIDNLLKDDQFSAVLFAGAASTDRPVIKYNRTASRNAGAMVDCTSTITSVAPSSVPVLRPLQTIAGSFDVCDTGLDQYSSFTSPLDYATFETIKGLSHTLAAQAMTGDGQGLNLFGLETETLNSVNASGASDLLGKLDEAWDAVLSKGTRMVWVFNPAARRSVIADLRDTGNITMGELYGTTLQVPFYAGAPILKSEFVGSGDGFLVNLDDFRMEVGTNKSANAGTAGIFSMKRVPRADNLNTQYIMHANVVTYLTNTQGSVKIENIA